MSMTSVEKRLMRDVGSPEEILESLMKFRIDVDLLARQRRKLTKKYANKWVAVYDGQVKSIADTLDELLKMVDKQGLPRNKVAIQFLSTEKRTMIL